MKFKTLSNGERIPVLGFGVFQVQKAGAARQAVINAIRAGYRLIDTAASYGNEREVGEGIAEAIKQGLVTTKRTLIEFIVDSDKLRIH
ncbi:aldo/keto reductase [Levilactobacillus brevis]|jgi:2,5-diketo-D-gluconate reductase A|nr:MULTISPECIES: aldo/keto reductase [Lactobacillaceae]MBD5807582.1 aldo/keto reductase [Limosilactobacillus fermentum]MBS7687574.1 aldo/keto reductase [Limosilactobacillus fermentum]MCE0561195.1 aldo/keto reductase [Limosilactobacillus fermentum]MCE6034698.1 aldo/keto reductase [Levilactobacillus brevis]MCT3588152.1 aldo/keto reductase [Levilactobacillus brevis]